MPVVQTQDRGCFGALLYLKSREVFRSEFPHHGVLKRFRRPPEYPRNVRG